MLKAVASQDTWIWHAFFGVAGSNNDINVLNQSPLFNYYEDGTAPTVPFTVNGTEYRYPYFLVDGIYPRYAMFVKTIPHPTGEKRIRFSKAQEAARKDVERAFGILKKRWKILKEPARPMEETPIRKMMYACIILHNMILKDEGLALCPNHIPDPPVQPHHSDDRILEMQDQNIHEALRMDLIDHIHRTFIPGLDR